MPVVRLLTRRNTNLHCTTMWVLIIDVMRIICKNATFFASPSLYVMSDSSPAKKNWLAHYSELMGFWRRKHDVYDEGEDAIQDAAANLLKRGTDTIEDPRAYISRSTTNGLISRHRHNAALPMLSWDELEEPDARDTSTPESHVQSQQLLDALMAALSELPAPCRQVYILHRLEGWTHTEIATHMAISRSMVEKHMQRALRHILTRLEHYAPY